MLTTERLAAIRERCEKATPGPLKIDPADYRMSLNGFNDADFIFHAREDIPALLEEREGLIWRLQESNKIAECSFERGSATWRKIADKFEQERDRWKARCEAMEVGVKQSYGAQGDYSCAACYICIHHNSNDMWCGHENCNNWEDWQFDEARFGGACSNETE